MHPIIIKMRQQKITLKKWATAHGYTPEYCSMVIAGKRGALGFGKGQEIIEALKLGGFWIESKTKGKK